MANDHPDLTEALTTMELVEPAYVEAESFYTGEVDEILASAKLQELLGNDCRKYRINYARTPVDVLLERTKIQGWTCSDTAQLAAIEQAWADNQLGIEAKDVAAKAYTFGDAYLIAWPEEDDPDFPAGVSIYAHSPLHVRVFYDPQKPRRKRMALHRWLEWGDDVNGLRAGEQHQRVNLYYPDRLEQWVSEKPTRTSVGGVNPLRVDDRYLPFTPDGADYIIDNPVDGTIPVFHFRTARPYGRPEHADAYGPQRGINKLYISLMGAVDYAVLPQRYVATESEVDQVTPDHVAEAFGEVNTLDPEYQDGLDATSSMETGPGNVWLLSGKSVKPGQFSAADSANFIAPMESLVQQMADVTDLPANRYHKGGEQPSGDSQRMSEVPLNNKVDDRHAQFGVTWHELAQFVCDLNNLGETDAQVNWSPPETYDDADAWTVVHLKLKSGLPFDQVMREMGYGSDMIEEWQPYAAGVVAALVGQADTLSPTTAEDG